MDCNDIDRIILVKASSALLMSKSIQRVGDFISARRMYYGGVMKEKFSKYVGNIEYASGLEMKYVYMQLAETDQQTADVLYKQKLYNQAVYFYIQSMEKKIKSCICEKVNMELPFYANKLKEIGHSLDKSIVFLIEILSGNNVTLKTQLEKQLLVWVFENIRFLGLYNNCRYPKYVDKC